MSNLTYNILLSFLGFIGVIVSYLFVRSIIALVRLKLAQKRYYPMVSHLKWSHSISSAELSSKYPEIVPYSKAYKEAWFNFAILMGSVILGFILIALLLEWFAYN